MSIATIAAVATYAMAAYSTVVAIKAIADGDYATALIAGVGAFAGFSAAGGLMSSGASQAAAGTGAMSAMGTSPVATLAATQASPIAAATTGTAMSGAAAAVPTAVQGLSAMGAVPAASSAFSPAVAAAAPAATGVSGAISNLGDMFSKSGVGSVVDNMKQIGADLFQDVNSGGLFNSAGKSLGNLGGGSTLGGIAQIASPILKYASQRDQQEASDKQREEEKGYIDRDWTNRNTIVDVPLLGRR